MWDWVDPTSPKRGGFKVSLTQKRLRHDTHPSTWHGIQNDHIKFYCDRIRSLLGFYSVKAIFVLRCRCWVAVNFFHANGGVYLFICLLMAMSWKVCCLCVMWDRVAVEDGWLNAIHACKEDGKNKRLDEDNRRDLKEK
jgi:hypothetical protein